MESDRAYFARRAQEETLAAATAGHPKARQVHLDLAGRYADMAKGIERYEKALEA